MEILTTKTDFVFADQNGENSSLNRSPPLSWQAELKTAIRSRTELLKRLNLPQNNEISVDSTPIAAINHFPVFVPNPYLNRIRAGDANDPLLRQVLPLPDEDASVVGYTADPLGETAATRGAGLLQKYAGRVLLVTTGACAVNCRYCFRRHFPYEESPKSLEHWQDSIQQIADDPSITEAILSGGDPLTMVDEPLAMLIDQLSTIPHLQRLRIHTRLPIMIPQRVTVRLLEMLTSTRLQTIIVIHSNHANELDDAVKISLGKLADAGIMLLNQSVLLRGVNDEAATLIDLSQRLLACRVMPYYLHKNDPIAGTAHFEVSIARGIELIETMRTQLPGYAVPRFVQEIAGKANKTILA